MASNDRVRLGLFLQTFFLSTMGLILTIEHQQLTGED